MTSVGALEATYRRLANVPADAAGFRVAPVADGSSFMAAIDPQDLRHVLAGVPMAAAVIPDTRSAGIQVHRRELIDAGRSAWFVDVSSRATRFNELFVVVADEILAEWAVMTEGRPDLVASTVLERWRDLLAREHVARPLSLDELVGLVGELMVLRDLGGHVEFWAGPKGGRHDFVSSGIDLEVKSTRRRAGFEVEIHSLDQLTPAPGARLFLVFNRLEEAQPDGASVGSLVDALVRAGSDSVALVERIASVSATPELLDPSPRRFRLLERQVYAIEEGFPGISVDDVRGWPRTGVTYIRYGLDLAASSGLLDSEALSRIALEFQANR